MIKVFRMAFSVMELVLTSDFCTYIFFPILALAFLATVPCMLYRLFRR